MEIFGMSEAVRAMKEQKTRGDVKEQRTTKTIEELNGHLNTQKTGKVAD